MEINNNFTRCGKCGRFYNPKTHDSCPYCREGAPGPTGGTVPPTEKAPNGMPSGGVPPTEPADRTYGSQPSGGQGGFSPTEPPYGAQPGRMGGGDFQHTIIGGGLNVDGGVEPVVGWLVCTEGPSRGKSYTIRGGINAIGRGDRMDITITGDRTISMENHAKISYSDRNNRFNLLPGDGRNIVYLNGEEVFSATPLQAYDLIDFGETKLLFVPLCGERFTWKQEAEKSDGPA